MLEFAADAGGSKFGKMFDFIDIDRDGVATLDDWTEFATYVCSQFDEPIDSLIGAQVKEAVLSWWYAAVGRMDGSGHRLLTRLEFVAIYDNVNEATIRAIIDQYVDALFVLCDNDADGRFSRRALARVLRAHGVREDEMGLAMGYMTAAEGSDIGRQAYTDLLLDLCLGEDTPASGRRYLGKI